MEERFTKKSVWFLVLLVVFLWGGIYLASDWTLLSDYSWVSVLAVAVGCLLALSRGIFFSEQSG